MASYDLDTAKQKVTDYATSKWGRGPQDDNEWGIIGQGINYDDGVDDNELNQAYGNADTYAQSIGGVPKQPAAPPPPAAAPPPPQQGPAPPSPIQQAFQGGLLNLINRSQQTPSLDDPTLAPQMRSFQVANQRGAERQRASAAERLAHQGMASGGAGGALDSAVGQIESGRTLNEANFGAGLLGNEMQARRSELMQGLQLAMASGNADAARDLQRELSLLDINLRQQGLNLNERLGLGDLDLRNQAVTQQGQLGKGDLLLRYLFGLQGNEQFYDQLGLGASQWMYDQNQDSFWKAMGGF